MKLTNIIVSLVAMSGLASAIEAAKMKTAYLRTKPDGYSELNEELRNWLESE